MKQIKQPKYTLTQRPVAQPRGGAKDISPPLAKLLRKFKPNVHSGQNPAIFFGLRPTSGQNYSQISGEDLFYFTLYQAKY